MQSKSEIDIIFENQNLNLERLFELLPLGIITFNFRWELISINQSANSILISNNEQKKIPFNANMFLDNVLSEILPLSKLLKMKEGLSIEDEILITNKDGSIEQIIIKGIPLIKENSFNGGLLLLQNKNNKAEYNKDFITEYSVSEILTKICSCYVITDLDGKILLKSGANSNRCIENEFAVGKNIKEIFNNEQQLLIQEKIGNASTENKNQFLALKYFSDVETIDFNTVLIPLTYNAEQVRSILFLFKDNNYLTDEAVDYLNDSKELKQYKSFTSAGFEAILKTNLHGIITYFPEKSELFFNRKKAEILSKFISEIFPEINKNLFEKIRSELIINKSWAGEFKYFNLLDGLFVRTKIKLYKDDRTVELLFYCDKENIQNHKLKLAQEEEKNFFRDTVIKADEIILQTNAYGTILFANEKFCTEFGYEIDEIRGIALLDLVEHGFRLENDLTDFANSIYQKSFDMIPMLTKNGNIIDVEPIINISLVGTTLKYFTVYLTKVDHKQKLKLEISDGLLDSFPNAVVMLKHNFIIYYNNKFKKLLDEKSDFINKEFSTIISESDKDKYEKFISSENLNTHSELLSITIANGKTLKVNLKKVFESKPLHSTVLEILPDQSKINKSQNELKLENENIIHQKSLREIDHAYFIGQIEANEIKINSFNSSIETITDYDKDSFLFDPNLWNNLVYPDDYEKYKTNIQNFIRGENNTIHLEYRIITRSGEIVWISNKMKKIEDSVVNKNKIIGIIDNITTITSQREELTKKIKELEKLNNTKDKFISIISHDLKSPFTSIVGFTELALTDSTLTIDDMREYIGHIKDASMHTLELVNSLLDWTRLQTGRLAIKPVTVNANYLVRKTTEILNGFAAQKGISLIVDVDESIFVQADEGILTQVFNNLVSNSLKFTPKDGSISILAKRLDEQQKIQFTVKDTGVGIDEEDIKKLFIIEEKFTTLGTDGERGTGLGLSLVKEIVERHNGKIYVKSELGKGTEFIFTIPISTPSILLIDDKQTERIIYSKLVESLTEGIIVYTASDFENAKTILKEKMPMLIISESIIDGVGACEFYRSIHETQSKYRPSYFVLTRNITSEESEKCKKLGIDSVQSKPIDIKLLKIILDELILGIEE